MTTLDGLFMVLIFCFVESTKGYPGNSSAIYKGVKYDLYIIYNSSLFIFTQFKLASVNLSLQNQEWSHR